MKNFSIPAPCSEDWNEMKPTEKGAFCSSCAHEVHDVSSMSNQEIRTLFLNNLGKRTCLRMNPEQESTMNLDFLEWQKSKQNHMRMAMLFSLIVVFGLTLFSCTNPEQVKDLENLRNVVHSSVSEIDSDKLEHAVASRPSKIVTNSDIERKVIPVQEFKNQKEETNDSISEVDLIFEEIEVVREFHTIRIDGHLMGAPRLDHNYIEFIKKEASQSKEELRSQGIITEFKGLAFPNPAVDQTTLEIELPESTQTLYICLIDLNGRLLEEINNDSKEMGVHRFPINLSDLKAGTYLADVRYNDKKQIVRIIKGY